MKLLGNFITFFGILLFIVLLILLKTHPDYNENIFSVLLISATAFFTSGIYISRIRRRSFKNGEKTTGILLSIHDTRAAVNDEPKLKLTVRFTALNGEIITSSNAQAVSLLTLVQLKTGMDIPLCYDINNPNNIIIDLPKDMN